MFHRHMSFRGPWRERWFQKGDLKYVILDLIKDKPRSGYDIIRALEERSHGFYSPSPGTIYPTLQMLEEMGYVISEQQDGKKIYTITEEGRSFLSKQEDFTQGIKRQMRDWWNPEDMKEMSHIMSEFGKLGQIVFRGTRGVSSEKMERIREVISDTCRKVEDIIRE